MTCAKVVSALLAFPDWASIFALMFLCATFGACVCWLVFEIRYRVGIDYQRRIRARERMFGRTE